MLIKIASKIACGLLERSDRIFDMVRMGLVGLKRWGGWWVVVIISLRLLLRVIRGGGSIVEGWRKKWVLLFMMILILISLTWKDLIISILIKQRGRGGRVWINSWYGFIIRFYIFLIIPTIKYFEEEEEKHKNEEMKNNEKNPFPMIIESTIQNKTIFIKKGQMIITIISS